VPVLDSGARGATTTFVQRGVGDVLIAWENEALLALKEFGSDKFEIVVPSATILAEPPVAVVDKVARKHGTEKVAHAYLEYLYSPEAQELAAKYYYRPRLKSVADKYASVFPKVNTFTVDEGCGGWQNAQAKHFSDGEPSIRFTENRGNKCPYSRRANHGVSSREVRLFPDSA